MSGFQGKIFLHHSKFYFHPTLCPDELSTIELSSSLSQMPSLKGIGSLLQKGNRKSIFPRTDIGNASYYSKVLFLVLEAAVKMSGLFKPEF